MSVQNCVTEKGAYANKRCSFDQFFNTPDVMSGMPSVIGFDGFFRGAFLYHYHNEWYVRHVIL